MAFLTVRIRTSDKRIMIREVQKLMDHKAPDQTPEYCRLEKENMTPSPPDRYVIKSQTMLPILLVATFLLIFISP
jgi:hypothetical protein